MSTLERVATVFIVIGMLCIVGTICVMAYDLFINSDIPILFKILIGGGLSSCIGLMLLKAGEE